jgi:hypothetical protein
LSSPQYAAHACFLIVINILHVRPNWHFSNNNTKHLLFNSGFQIYALSLED